MKKISLSFILSLSFVVSSLVSAQGINESLRKKLKYLNYRALVKIGFIEGSTIGYLSGATEKATSNFIENYFQTGGNYRCHALQVRKWTHPNYPQKKFFTVSTHDDECDGGNTMGVMVDYEQISKASLLAEISDDSLYPLSPIKMRTQTYKTFQGMLKALKKEKVIS